MISEDETQLWITNRVRLSSIVKSVFSFSSASEYKAVNAFLLNEARPMISTLMVNDVNFHCFYSILEELIQSKKVMHAG